MEEVKAEGKEEVRGPKGERWARRAKGRTWKDAVTGSLAEFGARKERSGRWAPRGARP